MNKIRSIAQYTFIESVRNRIFYILIMFGLVIIGASLLLAALSGEQSLRILLDLGLGSIEFFALLTAVFSAVTLILEEMESKTIYLVLTRPVSRAAYLTGRFAGLMAAVYAGMAVMAVMHMAILLFNGWDFAPRYILALFLSAGKVTILGTVALFMSLFSSSAVSSIAFTVLFWLLGHAAEEIRYLSTKLTAVIPKLFIAGVYYLVPNMQYFNVRDFWDVPGVFGGWIGVSCCYGIAYSMFFLGLSLWLFSRKEF